MEDATDRPPRGPGRPPHEPTDDSRRLVVQMVADGSAVTAIADQLGVSEPTLRRHYADELLTERPQLGLPLEGDLGTAPPREGDKGGRPPHVPTDEARRKVEVLAATGMYDWQIAAALEISVPTLRLHYADAMMYGASRKRAEMIDAMFRAGLDGKVAAQKAFIALCREHGDAPLQDAPAPVKAEAAAAPKLGKKEQALIDAKEPDRSSTLGALMAERQGIPASRLN